MGGVAAALSDIRSVRISAVVAESPVHPLLESGTLGHRGGYHRIRRLANLVCIGPSVGTVARIGAVTGI